MYSLVLWAVHEVDVVIFIEHVLSARSANGARINHVEPMIWRMFLAAQQWLPDFAEGDNLGGIWGFERHDH
jgi:hypothetical protein